MADQKKWFKVWTSLLVDMDNLSDSDIGQWTRLGCRIALVGNSGTVVFEGGWPHLARFFHVPDKEAEATLRRLPGIIYDLRENGAVSVKMENWLRYQGEDWTPDRNGLVKTKTGWTPRAEHEFSKILDGLGVKYVRQQRFPFKKTFYTLDFYSADLKIGFEVNGPEHSTSRYRALDQRKSEYLMSRFSVLVIPVDNGSILSNPEFVASYMKQCIESRSVASNAPSEKRREEIREEENREETTGGSASATDSLFDPVEGEEVTETQVKDGDGGEPKWGTPEALVTLWNKTVPEKHPKARIPSRGHIRYRECLLALKKFPQKEFWEEVFAEITKSQLLQGKKPSKDHPNWCAEFDWVIGGKVGTENCIKIVEGKYRDDRFGRGMSEAVRRAMGLDMDWGGR